MYPEIYIKSTPWHVSEVFVVYEIENLTIEEMKLLAKNNQNAIHMK